MKISVSIDVSKIDREKHIKRFGKDNKPFLKLTLHEKEGQYGDDGFVTVYLPDWAPGEKSPIVGNWRYVERPAGGTRPPTEQEKAASKPKSADEDSEIPF